MRDRSCQRGLWRTSLCVCCKAPPSPSGFTQSNTPCSHSRPCRSPSTTRSSAATSTSSPTLLRSAHACGATVLRVLVPPTVSPLTALGSSPELPADFRQHGHVHRRLQGRLRRDHRLHGLPLGPALPGAVAQGKVCERRGQHDPAFQERVQPVGGPHTRLHRLPAADLGRSADHVRDSGEGRQDRWRRWGVGMRGRPANWGWKDWWLVVFCRPAGLARS